MQTKQTVQISANFDSGNIQVLDASQPGHVRLAIRRDTHCEFMQWFHFRVSDAAGVPLRLCIENAGDCSYADGWHGYACAASYDRQHWFRIPTTFYDGHALTIEVTPQHDTLWLAYFEPYSHERHQELVGRCNASPLARVERIGTSLQGRDLDCVHAGSGAHHVWIQARQHPGESMAEWCAEGLLARLLDPHDAVAREVRRLATLHIVPNANPDGATLGNLRANAAGANLNREWRQPSMERSPEVWHIQAAMRATGMSLFLDLHGDETLPYVFIDGSHMVPGYGERNLQLQADFLANLRTACPDFQTEHGYADNRFDEELLTLASKWTARTFGCVALTLEMPFKDNANAPDTRHGWNGERSRQTGAALLGPILQHLKALGA